MSIAAVVSRKLSGLVLAIVSIFKRLLCFLHIRRGRRNSGTILPLHSENVPQSVPINDVAVTEEVELEAWDSWGENAPGFGLGAQVPNNASSRRPHTMPVFLNTKPEPEPELDVNYFEDMTPKIKKAAKIRVKQKDDGELQGLSSRLTMTSVHLAPIEVGGGLDTWQDNENGWGEEAMEDLSWEAESAIREKKKFERERRLQEHQQRKVDKEMARNNTRTGQFSAVRLS